MRKVIIEENSDEKENKRSDGYIRQISSHLTKEPTITKGRSSEKDKNEDNEQTKRDGKETRDQ